MQQIGDIVNSLGGLDTQGGLLPANPKTQTQAQLSFFHEDHFDFLALRRRVRDKYESGR
jgi:hypothetical protein